MNAQNSIDPVNLDVWMRVLLPDELMAFEIDKLPVYMGVLYCFKLSSGLISVGHILHPRSKIRTYIKTDINAVNTLDISCAYFTRPHTNCYQNKDMLYDFLRAYRVRGAVFKASFNEVCSMMNGFSFLDEREAKEKSAQAFLNNMKNLLAGLPKKAR